MLFLYAYYSVRNNVYCSAVSKPVIKPLKRVSSTGVRVEWSQPGKAAVTGYVVFYYDGSVIKNLTVPLIATSANITGLSITVRYVISVMALSEPPCLPGRSSWENFTLC